MSNNSSVIARCTSESTAVAYFLLDVADDGTFWALADGEDVADCKLGFLACVDEGAGVETFSCDECFFAEFVAVGVTENDTGEGGTTEEPGSLTHNKIDKITTHRPESWMISFTIPRTYPFRSAKSRARSLAGFLFRWVCDLN